MSGHGEGEGYGRVVVVVVYMDLSLFQEYRYNVLIVTEQRYNPPISDIDIAIVVHLFGGSIRYYVCIH